MIQRSFIVLFLIFAQHVLSDRRPLYELRSSKTFFIEVKGLKLKSVRLNDTKEILLRESPDSFPSDVVVCRTADGAGDGGGGGVDGGNSDRLSSLGQVKPCRDPGLWKAAPKCWKQLTAAVTALVESGPPSPLPRQARRRPTGC